MIMTFASGQKKIRLYHFANDAHVEVYNMDLAELYLIDKDTAFVSKIGAYEFLTSARIDSLNIEDSSQYVTFWVKTPDAFFKAEVIKELYKNGDEFRFKFYRDINHKSYVVVTYQSGVSSNETMIPIPNGKTRKKFYTKQ